MIEKLSIKEWMLIYFLIEVAILLLICWHVLGAKETVKKLFNESELVRYLKKLGGE